MSTPVPDARALVEAVLARSSHRHSVYHGDRHWRRVAAAGLELLGEEPAADRTLVFLFALFHDCRRRHDGHDPRHGERGAALARELLDGEPYRVSEERMDLLEFALVGHDDGRTSEDPTVGVCWDSDRLNLWRVGLMPTPALLSTPAAKKPERIEWARGVVSGAFRWEDLARDYGLPWGPA